MAWHSCGPETPDQALSHEQTAGKARMCPSSELISGSPYPHHDASSSWASKDPGKVSTTCVDSDPTGEEELKSHL